jgi:hypothetical protein
MEKTKNFPGMDGFIWWTGIVEDRKDPLKVGRVRVRIFGWHKEDKSNVPSDGLLWAQPVMSANAYQISHVPKEGEVLFGFFMDGEYAQVPFYMGVIPNIPEIRYPKEKGFSDPATEEEIKLRPRTLHSGQTRYPGDGELNQPTISRSARNENMDQTPYGKAHGGKYPYVFSIQTESGHYLDLDDTPNAERVTLIHRTGSFISIDSGGNITISGKNVNIIATGSINNKAPGGINEDTPNHKTTGTHTDAIGIHYSGG